ncbi:MAG: hypothetical protein ACUVQR_01445 [Thermogutta sp.]
MRFSAKGSALEDTIGNLSIEQDLAIVFVVGPTWSEQSVDAHP